MAPADVPVVEDYEPEAPRYTREAEEQDIRGRRGRIVERIAAEDMALIAGVPSEEAIASLRRGWAPDYVVAEAARAYRYKLVAPWLMESEEIPANV